MSRYTFLSTAATIAKKHQEQITAYNWAAGHPFLLIADVLLSVLMDGLHAKVTLVSTSVVAYFLTCFMWTNINTTDHKIPEHYKSHNNAALHNRKLNHTTTHNNHYTHQNTTNHTTALHNRTLKHITPHNKHSTLQHQHTTAPLHSRTLQITQQRNTMQQNTKPHNKHYTHNTRQLIILSLVA